ncbi:type IV pilus biogenesis/stability protein PilW [Oxalobacteraceae bacterium R-40]|uniref:Type IV pilus biogenesis/stability protein PilW n=1 Tax=Keguizhuia sedimenti TaxID=3064264 RepID=A0ABU1BSS5_9BURK|nr:type IV pilus biogenesis/stability protein PilW [Oxalobacteraceae bacterium R-40]
MIKSTWFRSLILCGVVAVAGAGCGSMSGESGTSELSTVSDQTDNQRRAQIRLQLAVGYFQQGQMSVALDELKQALQSDPDFADAYNMRGLIYMEMGETRLAEDNFLRALKLAPNNPETANNYGWFLCQNGREKESIAYFEAALRNKSYQSPVVAMNNAGICSLKLKDLASAERYLTQAFQDDPSRVDTNVNLAKYYVVRSEYQRARFYMTRAIKSGRLGPDALWTGIKIERKLGDRTTENSLATQLRRNFPKSKEFAAYLRGAFDE